LLFDELLSNADRLSLLLLINELLLLLPDRSDESDRLSICRVCGGIVII